eukprot:1891155-Pyramimonas_sp.AAC.1
MLRFPFYLPHEAFAAQYEEDPLQFDVGRLAPELRPGTYDGHPVRLEKGGLCVPVDLYSDGVPFSKKD